MARKQAVSKQSKYGDLKTWNEKGQLKEGDQIDGYYIDKEVFTSKYGEGVIYILLLNDGKMIKIMGQTDIRNKMEENRMSDRLPLVEYIDDTVVNTNFIGINTKKGIPLILSIPYII